MKGNLVLEEVLTYPDWFEAVAEGETKSEGLAGHPERMAGSASEPVLGSHNRPSPLDHFPNSRISLFDSSFHRLLEYEKKPHYFGSFF